MPIWPYHDSTLAILVSLYNQNLAERLSTRVQVSLWQKDVTLSYTDPVVLKSIFSLATPITLQPDIISQKDITGTQSFKLITASIDHSRLFLHNQTAVMHIHCTKVKWQLPRAPCWLVTFRTILDSKKPLFWKTKKEDRPTNRQTYLLSLSIQYFKVLYNVLKYYTVF